MVLYKIDRRGGSKNRSLGQAPLLIYGCDIGNVSAPYINLSASYFATLWRGEYICTQRTQNLVHITFSAEPNIIF